MLISFKYSSFDFPSFALLEGRSSCSFSGSFVDSLVLSSFLDSFLSAFFCGCFFVDVSSIPNKVRISVNISGSAFCTGLDLNNRAVTFASAGSRGPALIELLILFSSLTNSGDSAIRFVLFNCLSRYRCAVSSRSRAYHIPQSANHSIASQQIAKRTFRK